jgi:hypothetical protein
MWIDQLRDLLIAHLGSANTGVLSVPVDGEVVALSVRYQSDGLAIYCLVPRWSEAADALGASRSTLLIIPAADPRRWLRYQGVSRPADQSAWAGPWPDHLTPRQADERWLVVALTPQRLDLFDERRGWGARETLDFAPT